jgi:hypothetical protein
MVCATLVKNKDYQDIFSHNMKTNFLNKKKGGKGHV